MDALFNKNVFHPDQKKIPKETRSELAAEEAVKTKRCLQSLRYLWRNARQFSHCPRVQSLKDYLAPSPLQDRRQDQGPQALEDHQSSDSEGEGPADMDIEVEEPQASPVSSENGGDEGDDDPSGNGGHESDDDPSENGGHESDDDPSENGGHEVPSENEDRCDGGRGEESSEEVVDVSAAPVAPQHEVADTLSDTDSSLKAPTLCLDDCHPSPSSPAPSQNSPESDPDMRDSQVGSGWLGKFYAKYGRFGKDENTDPNLPRCVVEGDTQGMLDHIRDSLVGGNAELGE